MDVLQGSRDHRPVVGLSCPSSCLPLIPFTLSPTSLHHLRARPPTDLPNPLTSLFFLRPPPPMHRQENFRVIGRSLLVCFIRTLRIFLPEPLIYIFYIVEGNEEGENCVNIILLSRTHARRKEKNAGSEVSNRILCWWVLSADPSCLRPVSRGVSSRGNPSGAWRGPPESKA